MTPAIDGWAEEPFKAWYECLECSEIGVDEGTYARTIFKHDIFDMTPKCPEGHIHVMFVGDPIDGFFDKHHKAKTPWS